MEDGMDCGLWRTQSAVSSQVICRSVQVSTPLCTNFLNSCNYAPVVVDIKYVTASCLPVRGAGAASGAAGTCKQWRLSGEQSAF